MGDFRQRSPPPSSKYQMREYLLEDWCSSLQWSSETCISTWWPKTLLRYFTLFFSLICHPSGTHAFSTAVFIKCLSYYKEVLLKDWSSWLRVQLWFNLWVDVSQPAMAASVPYQVLSCMDMIILKQQPWATSRTQDSDRQPWATI